MKEQGVLWLETMLGGAARPLPDFRPSWTRNDSGTAVRIPRETGPARVYSVEHVLWHLRRSVEGFGAPFPSKPPELQGREEIFHVESDRGVPRIVILRHAPRIATLEIEPDTPDEAAAGLCVPSSDDACFFTLSLPAICWFLVFAGGALGPMTEYITAFFVRPARLEFDTKLCIPALLNVAGSPTASLPFAVCAPFRHHRRSAAEPRTLAEEIEWAQQNLLFTRWSWDIERHNGRSALTVFRTRSTDSRLMSFGAWQAATLRGESIWTEERNFIPVCSLHQHMLEHLIDIDGFSTSLPYRIATALREMGRTVEPIIASRNAY
ncbi:MAG: hypothetical protein HY815_33860 [Candidatus Riflebacteria bacterium]|nr:hypothetical protein [Candidatus Riflebacteria bacterium]